MTFRGRGVPNLGHLCPQPLQYLSKKARKSSKLEENALSPGGMEPARLKRVPGMARIIYIEGIMKFKSLIAVLILSFSLLISEASFAEDIIFNGETYALNEETGEVEKTLWNGEKEAVPLERDYFGKVISLFGGGPGLLALTDKGLILRFSSFSGFFVPIPHPSVEGTLIIQVGAMEPLLSTPPGILISGKTASGQVQFPIGFNPSNTSLILATKPISQRVLIHEVGHLMTNIFTSNGGVPHDLFVEKSDGVESLGGHINITQYKIPDTTEVMGQIAISLAGHLAELIAYGPKSVSYGSESDIASAWKLALAICVGKRSVSIFRSEADLGEDGYFDREIIEEAIGYIDAGARLAVRIITEHPDLMVRIMHAAAQNEQEDGWRLDGHSIYEIYKGYANEPWDEPRVDDGYLDKLVEGAMISFLFNVPEELFPGPRKRARIVSDVYPVFYRYFEGRRAGSLSGEEYVAAQVNDFVDSAVSYEKLGAMKLLARIGEEWGIEKLGDIVSSDAEEFYRGNAVLLLGSIANDSSRELLVEKLKVEVDPKIIEVLDHSISAIDKMNEEVKQAEVATKAISIKKREPGVFRELLEWTRRLGRSHWR